MSDDDIADLETYVFKLTDNKSLADFIDVTEAASGKPFPFDVYRAFGEIADDDPDPRLPLYRPSVPFTSFSRAD